MWIIEYIFRIFKAVKFIKLEFITEKMHFKSFYTIMLVKLDPHLDHYKNAFQETHAAKSVETDFYH